jgi:thermolabile hemolysin
MQKNYFFKVILLLCIPFFSLTCFAADIPTFNEIVIFGDSLSDNGNLYKSSWGIIPKSPPYFKGRFSNGDTWADWTEKFFSDKYNFKTYNYAVGGETVVFHDPFEGYLPYTLSMSLTTYNQNTRTQDISHTLFIFWIGANDYLNGSKDPDKATSDVVNTIQEKIIGKDKDDKEGLINRGARNFLIINLPDIALTPRGRVSANAKNLHDLTVLHNQKLKMLIDQLQAQHSDITIRELDMFALYADLLANTDVYNQKYHTHIKNVTETCWPGGYTLKPNQESAIMQQLKQDFKNTSLTENIGLPATELDLKKLAHSIAKNPSLSIAYNVGQQYAAGVSACNYPDDYAFWDQVHPSAAAHGILGAMLIENVNQFYRVG